jgi:hypothetical protein
VRPLRTTDRWRSKEPWRKRPARDAVAELAQLAEQRRETEAAIERAVRTARSAGARWEDIGGVLGMSGPGARKRYGR